MIINAEGIKITIENGSPISDKPASIIIESIVKPGQVLCKLEAVIKNELGADLGLYPTIKIREIKRSQECKINCTCPQECDCQNPPPDNWDGRKGVYHVSASCPIHNFRPEPDPDCPIH